MNSSNKCLTNNNNIDDECNTNEYLGTFRWKNIKFEQLNKVDLLKLNNKDTIDKLINSFTLGWKEYLDYRFPNNNSASVTPYFIDALSYPMSIIQIINDLNSNYTKYNFNLLKDISEKLISYNTNNSVVFNIILIGASKKTEERIALNSNYYDEIYYFITALILKHYNNLNLNDNNFIIRIDKNNVVNNKQINSSKSIKLLADESKNQYIIKSLDSFIVKLLNSFELNLIFTGEEITLNNNYKSKNNSNLNYYFYSLKTMNFFKENSLEFTNTNSLVIGLNCGFGAGYIKLTNSWIKDIQLLLKMKYFIGFTCACDYEDFKGEKLIFEYLEGNILLENTDNKFKSMSTYTSQSNELKNNNDENWSCGNYCYYIVYGSKNNRKVIKENELINIFETNKLLKT